MTTATPTPTSAAELAVQLQDLRGQHEDAANGASAAREHASRLRGLALLNRATIDEVDAAEQAVATLDRRVADLAAAIAVLEKEHAEAQDEERQRRHAALAKRSKKLRADQDDALAALRAALDQVAAAVGSFDQDNGRLTDAAAELVAVAGLEDRISELRAKYQRVYETKVRSIPDREQRLAQAEALQDGQDDEIEALRSDAAARAAELAAPRDDAALREVSSGYASTIHRLLDEETRATLRLGFEFARGPVSQGSSSIRVYPDDELAAARDRLKLFVAALIEVAGPDDRPAARVASVRA